MNWKREAEYMAAMFVAWSAIDVIETPTFSLKWFICAVVIIFAFAFIRHSGRE